jgi:hypothetical protein
MAGRSCSVADAVSAIFESHGGGVDGARAALASVKSRTVPLLPNHRSLEGFRCVPGLILLAAEGALAALLLALVGALAFSYFGARAVVHPACSLRRLFGECFLVKGHTT